MFTRQDDAEGPDDDMTNPARTHMRLPAPLSYRSHRQPRGMDPTVADMRHAAANDNGGRRAVRRRMVPAPLPRGPALLLVLGLMLALALPFMALVAAMSLLPEPG
jgi:hypothetical protein